MLSDSVVLLTIPLSLGITGVIFLLIGVFLWRRFGYKGGTRTVGTLVGFRGNVPDYELMAKDRILGQGTYPVYDYNAANSKPIFRVWINGRMEELHSEWSVADLGRKDIGRELPVRYFTTRDGSPCKVIPEGRQYENQRDAGRKIMFWIFAGIGIMLCVAAGVTAFLLSAVET